MQAETFQHEDCKYNLRLADLSTAINVTEKVGMLTYSRSYDWRKPEARFRSALVGQRALRNDANSLAGNCPIAEDIAPCVCTDDGTDLVLDCSDVQSEAQLKKVFQAEFPVKEFFMFVIDNPHDLFHFNFSTNGVSFVEFFFTGSYISIQSISEEVFRDNAATVEYIEVLSSEIEDGGFPFEALSGYPSLVAFIMYDARLTQMPVIQSDSLQDLVLGRNQISTLEPGLHYGY